jgi:hypothetical protein
VAGARPGGTVRIALPATGQEATARVEPEGWRPPDAKDVAVLRLEEDLPESVQPLPMARSVGSKTQGLKIFGFPAVSPDGLWGGGEFLGDVKIGGMRVLQIRSPEVTTGFSGAPVWDSTIQRVVGMVTAITPPDEYRRLAETAFATPVDVLVGAWPEVLEVLLLEAEEEFLRENLRLGKLEAQLRRLAEQCTPTPDPVGILRQATKLFVGELAQALTGKPKKELRQLCLTQASKLPHSHHLDTEFLDLVLDHLGQLAREVRILLSAWEIEPLPGLSAALERRAGVLGDYLRRIYRMEPGDAFELGAKGAKK